MIFIDTSFFVALLDPKDRNHARAVAAFEEYEGQRLRDLFLTTNNVVLETITVARYEVYALAAIHLSDEVVRSLRCHGTI